MQKNAVSQKSLALSLQTNPNKPEIINQTLAGNGTLEILKRVAKKALKKAA